MTWILRSVEFELLRRTAFLVDLWGLLRECAVEPGRGRTDFWSPHPRREAALRLVAKMTDTRRRVKVYTLNEDRQWDDRGTGHVSSGYVDRLKGTSLLVRAESDGKSFSSPAPLEILASGNRRQPLTMPA